MLTDAEIVKLCAAIYSPQPPGFWDRYWDGSAPDRICAGIKGNVLVFRGSVTATDWFLDFLVAPHVPLDHPQLGIVHAGFYEGMDEFFEKTAKLLGQNPIVCGHSLGAARAWIYGGLLTATGNNPSRITVFGSPRPGGLGLANLLAPIPKASYKNGDDPVAEVPLWIGETMALEPISFTALHQIPTDWTEGLMAWHSIKLYSEGLNDAG